MSIKKRSPKKETAVVERLQRIKDKIKHYPTPIAGCDEQFNFLLRERDRLTLELTKFGDRGKVRREINTSSSPCNLISNDNGRQI